MAILKIIAHGKKREAKRKVLQYVLDPNKTQEGLPFVTGDFQADEITSKTVFQEFQRIRTLFGKDIKGNRSISQKTTRNTTSTTLKPTNPLMTLNKN